MALEFKQFLKTGNFTIKNSDVKSGTDTVLVPIASDEWAIIHAWACNLPTPDTAYTGSKKAQLKVGTSTTDIAVLAGTAIAAAAAGPTNVHVLGADIAYGTDSAAGGGDDDNEPMELKIVYSVCKVT